MTYKDLKVVLYADGADIEAMKREYAIKRLTRKQKEKLISGKVLPAVQIK